MSPSSWIIVCCSLAVVLSVSDAWFIFSDSGRQQAQGLISQTCIEKAGRGDCQFYICFDQRHPCDTDNYALSYGWRYCDKMETNYHRFTRQGKDWINATRVCSMMKMVEFYRATHINCNDVEGEMQDNHAACEAEHGVCEHELLMDNKEVLMDVYTFDRKMLVRFFGMIRECGMSSAGDFLSWATSQGKTVLAFFRSLPEQFSGLGDNIQALRDSLPEVSLPDIQIPEISLPSLPKLQPLPSVEDEDNK